jgi:hypothetical protein
MAKIEHKITVELDGRLRAFVEEQAERDERSMSSWLRRLISAEAARAASAGDRPREAA